MPQDSLNIYALTNNLAPEILNKFNAVSINNLSEVSGHTLQTDYSLLIVDQYCDMKELVVLEEQAGPRIGIIYLGESLSKDQIRSLLSLSCVIKILNAKQVSDSLTNLIEDAQRILDQRRITEGILDKVRTQNKILHELNENLENIVEKRTHHLEQSKNEIQQSNKAIKDLTKFIKSLASIEGLEDLMFVLRQEFLRYHKTRPPILIYSLQKGSYRCIYFQGQQLIDSTIHIEDQVIEGESLSQIRETLAGELGRPISPILCLFTKGLDCTGAFIFEHNMDALEQSAFKDVLEKRFESLQIAFDQTALKLRAHEISKQWSVTFDSLADPIVIIDSSYKVIRSNKVFNKQMGQSCYKVFAQNDSPCFGCPVQLAKDSKSSQKGKISVGDKIYEVNAYPIYLENEERFSNMIVHYTDITRATGLQSQLIQSEKMAAIGLLAGNIAHELNNPLTGIKSLAQLLLMEAAPDSTLHEDLNEVQMAANRSEQIIKNLLEFSSFKAPAGKSVSVRELILKTLPFLKTAMRYHNSVIDLSEEKDDVYVEPHLLQQVIFNLVNNACQAMGDTGKLHLSSEVSKEGVFIYVKDTGPGIPDDIQRAIFTPFFTTKEEGKGTGLGLSMSRSIIEKFGGSLKLIKSDDKGTEFAIWLPRQAKEE